MSLLCPFEPLACMRIKRIIATKLLVSGIELLNFRSKFLGLVPENLHTKILTNSNWLRYFLFSLVLFLFSFIAKKKKEMNKSKTNKANDFVSILRALKHILHFPLRNVPSLIFQFFKITFFKTKNFLSRRERCFRSSCVAT